MRSYIVTVVPDIDLDGPFFDVTVSDAQGNHLGAATATTQADAIAQAFARALAR